MEESIIPLTEPSFREFIWSKYMALSDEYIMQSNEAILARLMDLDEYKNADSLLIYYSGGREVDTKSIIRLSVENGMMVAVPVSTGSGLAFAEWKEPFRVIEQGIIEPTAVEGFVSATAASLMVVPGICFDSSGHRYGRGKGCFDKLSRNTCAVTVGLCREAMLQSGLPMDKCEDHVNIVLTEDRIIRCGD